MVELGTEGDACFLAFRSAAAALAAAAEAQVALAAADWPGGAGPRVRVLATSRIVLGLTGEHDYPIRPLPAEEATTLFVQRAQAVRPRFAPNGDGERAAVADMGRPTEQGNDMTPADLVAHGDSLTVQHLRAHLRGG